MTGFMKQTLISLSFFVACALPVSASDDNRLKGDIEITGATLSLADLIDGANVPADPVFGAPQPGKTGTIQVSRIIAAFKKATGKTLAASLETVVHVKRRARIITEADLADGLARLIARDYKILDPEISLHSENGPFELAIEVEAHGKPDFAILNFDPQSLRFDAHITVADSAMLKAKPIKISGHVAADRIVPVLSRAIDKGGAITSADIRMERRLRATLNGKTIPTLAELQSRVALVDLAPGDLASDDVIGRRTLIEKGSFVTVSYEANGLLLSMRGRATESGAIGDVIAFTNPQSKKTLMGTVTADGQIRVTSFVTKQARLNETPTSLPQ